MVGALEVAGVKLRGNSLFRVVRVVVAVGIIEPARHILWLMENIQAVRTEIKRTAGYRLGAWDD